MKIALVELSQRKPKEEEEEFMMICDFI